MTGSQKQSSVTKLCLRERDKHLLVDLYLQRAMSRDQIIALKYFGSVPRCNNRLKKLFDHRYVRRYQHSSRGSGSQALYCLGPAAVRVVAGQLGSEICEVARHAKRDAPVLFLDHTLGLVDLRIQFTRVALLQRLDQFTWFPEPLCRHEYSIKSAGGQWRQHVLKPDALARWSDGNKNRFCFIELDLGNVSLGAFERKVDSYLKYRDLGVFASAYDAEVFDVLVITTGQRRLDHLQEISAKSKLPKFFYTALRDIENNPFGCIWNCGGKQVSLFGGDS